MSRQAALFDPPPRAKPIKRMHVIDAGHDGPGAVLLRCGRCNHTSDWVRLTLTVARKGLPCPVCNVGKRSV